MIAAPQNPDTRPVRTTLMAALIQAVGGGLGWSLLPALMLSISAELKLDHSMTGLIWGLAPLGILLASPIGGAMNDRYGPTWVAGLAMFVGGLACAARALATEPWHLAVCMFAFGVHVAFAAPAIPKAIGAHVKPQHLGRANGAALLAYTFGTALTVLIGASVLAPMFGGWRGAMVAAGALMILAGGLWIWLVPVPAAANAGHASVGQVFALAKNKRLVALASIQFLLFGGYLALLGLLPRALTEGGVPGSSVGRVIAGWLAVAGVANLLGPWFSDRLGRRRPLIAYGAIVATLGLLGLSALPVKDSAWLLLVAAAGGGAFAPLLFIIPLELKDIGPARAGAAMGLLLMFGQVGGFLIPVVSGFMLQHFGLTGVFGLLSLIHLAILVPAKILGETGPKGAPESVAPLALPRLGSTT